MNRVWCAELNDRDWERVTEKQLDLFCDRLDDFWEALVEEIMPETKE